MNLHGTTQSPWLDSQLGAYALSIYAKRETSEDFINSLFIKEAETSSQTIQNTDDLLASDAKPTHEVKNVTFELPEEITKVSVGVQTDSPEVAAPTSDETPSELLNLAPTVIEWVNAIATINVPGNGHKVIEGETYRFKGFCKDGKPHGQGKLQLPDRTYRGNFENGVFHGHGMEEKNDGGRYEGFYDKGFRSGQGTYYYQDGEKYIGQFFLNRMTGKAKYIFINQSTYEGDYVDGVREGEGTYTEFDPNVAIWETDHRSGGTLAFKLNPIAYQHKGKYVNDFANGPGVSTRDGWTYEGNFVNGRGHGQGKDRHADYGNYVGEFVDGYHGGKGVETLKSGEIHEGLFENGRRHGRGKTTYLDGTFYIGDYVRGKRPPEKVLTYTNGDKYVGQIQDNFPHGFGLMTYGNNNTYTGEYVMGVRQGEGLRIYDIGEKYRGQFFADKCHGYGVLEKAGHFNYEGHFEAGEFQGKGKIVYANGSTYEGFLLKGQFDGFGAETLPTGEKYAGGFREGCRHGKGTLTTPTGEEKKVVYHMGTRKT